MNTANGSIRRLKQGEKPPEGYTVLTPNEYLALQGISEDQRPAELALFRFIEDRKKLGAPIGIEVKNAFRVGFKSALAMLNQGRVG